MTTTVKLPSLMRGLAVVVMVATTAACTSGQGGSVTPSTSSQVPLSTRLLSGTLAMPTGFKVGSINPLIPADGAPHGEVDASVMSPGGVTYGILFSPTVSPCSYAACTSATSTLTVGDASPAGAQTTFSPDLGTPARCGYDSDNPEVGCDAILGKEYISVRSNESGVSTSDAVAILRAALAYVRQSEG
jgi:hypothetical protein